MEENQKCGFISIVGRPNVGKSTLMNHLIGQKISITSRKPQTTQQRVSGIVTLNNAQYIFIDTPGFQQLYLNKLNNLLNQSVINSLSDVDVVLFVVEALIFNQGDQNVLNLLPNNKNVILVINKQDKVDNKYELNNYIESLCQKFPFKEVLLVSARMHNGIDEVLLALNKYIPFERFLYPEDQLTDRNTKFLVSEIIREKLFRNLGDELPYSLAVNIDEFDISNPKITHINATIIVDKDNQKGMVIGNKGNKLKKISSEARVDIEKLLNNKVFLQIWVKVKNGFADQVMFLKQFE